jgi:hypothetical protein
MSYRTTPTGRHRRGWERRKGTPGKEERYSDNKTKRSPYTENRKSVLIMRMRDQWTAGTMSDI